MHRNPSGLFRGAPIPFGIPGFPRFYLAPDDTGSGAGSGTEQTGAQQQGQGQEKTEVDFFSPAQQAKVQELINQAFGKASGKAEQKAATRIAELEAEIAKLKGGDQGTKDGKETAKGYDEDSVKKLLEGVRGEYEPKLTAATEIIDRLKGHQRNAAIVSAAAKAKAVDPEVVAKLIGDSVGFDEEGRLVVLETSGQPKLNRKAEPMAVEEFVAQYLDERPYLKQAANAGGGGSGTKAAGGGQPPERPKSFADAARQFGQRMSQ